MTGGVLKALHRRHEHAGGQSQDQSRCATHPKKNVISSGGVNIANPSTVTSLDGVLTPVSPEDALMASHQASSSSSSSGSTNTSNSSTPNISPITSPGLPPIPTAPKASPSLGLLPKKKHGLGLRSRSNSHASRSRSSSTATSASTRPANTGTPAASSSPVVPPVLQRFPSRVELRAQYDRHGHLVRAVEEFYDHDATMPCLAYGTPPAPVGSDAFGRPPPYM